MKRHWVLLQLRFEASNAIASDGLEWQYITIIVTFLVPFYCLETDIFVPIKSVSAQIVCCHVMRGRPQFLFSPAVADPELANGGAKVERRRREYGGAEGVLLGSKIVQ